MYIQQTKTTRSEVLQYSAGDRMIRVSGCVPDSGLKQKSEIMMFADKRNQTRFYDG